MTPVRAPKSLVDATDHTILVPAAYFVIRALRNALRDRGASSVSEELEGGARATATKALREIEALEGAPVERLPAERVGDYIEAIESLARDAYAGAVGGVDGSRAERLLTELRQHT